MAASIPIPDFKEPVESHFVETVVEKLLEYYTPDNGHYAKNHLYDFGDKTRMYMNVGETLRILSTPVDEKGEQIKDYDKNDYADNLAMTSVRMMTSIPAIMDSLSKKLPEKLTALNWECTKLDFSLYNPDKFMGFKGKDPATRTELYGAPACMFVLSLKPVAGKVTICAPSKVYEKKPYIKKQEKQEETKEEETTPAPTASVKQTYTKPSPASAFTPATGGARKPYTGRAQAK